MKGSPLHGKTSCSDSPPPLSPLYNAPLPFFFSIFHTPIKSHSKETNCTQNPNQYCKLWRRPTTILAPTHYPPLSNLSPSPSPTSTPSPPSLPLPPPSFSLDTPPSQKWRQADDRPLAPPAAMEPTTSSTPATSARNPSVVAATSSCTGGTRRSAAKSAGKSRSRSTRTTRRWRRDRRRRRRRNRWVRKMRRSMCRLRVPLLRFEMWIRHENIIIII